MSPTLFSILAFLVYGIILALFSNITYISYKKFGINVLTILISLLSSGFVLAITLYLPFYLNQSFLDRSDYKVQQKKYSVEFVTSSDTIKSENTWVKKHAEDTSKVKLKRTKSFDLFGNVVTDHVLVEKYRRNNEKE